MPKFWNFIKNAATETEPESVDLRIEGEIVDDDDIWIYEWYGITATAPNAFREELEKLAGINLIVAINSYGGNVFAASGFYNALVDHKKTGAKVTTKTDQKAMSAATIPYMAGDDRLMGPSDMIMVHNPLTDVYGYANDLRKVADVLDEVKEAILNAYEIGTGIKRDVISQMMNDETYMNVNAAIKEGFATGIINDTLPGVNVTNLTFPRAIMLRSTNEAVRRMVALKQPKDPPGDPPGDDIELAKARLALELAL
jgi:ATP-dependent Clp protease protease subunit